MADNTRSRLIPGVVLVLVGLFLLLIQFMQSAAGFAVVALGVILLLSYYLLARPLGILIPGLILIGFGAFAGLLQAGVIPNNFESLFFIFLGVPFLMVYTLHTRRAEDWGERNWPLFTGLILSVLTVLFLLVQNEFILKQAQWDNVLQWWPVVLIGVGIWLLVRKK